MRNSLDFRLAVLFTATFICTASSKYSKVHEHDWTHLHCSHDESVEVESANYGYGSGNRDSKDIVRGHCCAQSTCSFKVENDNLGGDPSWGNEKDLSVYYYCKRLPHCQKKVCKYGTAECSSCDEKLLYKIYNGQCIATKEPTLLTCQMTVHGDGGEMQYSPAIGTKECKNQQDFYGRFQIKSLTIKMVSEYEVSPTSKKPNFVASYTFGVTEAIVSVQRRNLSDPTPRKIIHKALKHDGNTKPQRLLEKNASLTLTDILSDGDRICVVFEVKGGGYVVAQNLITKSTAKYQYSRPSNNKEICFYFDITAPVHCSQTKECNEEALSLSERILDSLQITASTSTWKDPFPQGGSSKHASGISSLDITVNEMIPKGEILSRGKNVMSMKLNSSATFELPESKTPVLYEILLEVKDVADNVRKTRRFALFDNSSNIEFDQNSPIRATSASSETKFIWQTNLKMVCFSWNGRYVNKLHVNGQFLTRIESDEDISKHYEQTTGLLPVNGTRNINGITSYNFTLHRNGAVVKEGVVHNFTSETICINTKISDGDNLTFELTASDIVRHAITESTYLLVDSTVPDLGEIYLERNGEKRLFVHSEKDLSTMKLHFEAFDVHSGMHEIQWSLRASENNVLLGMGAISINRLSKNVTCSSSFCYCPKQGPCELSNHTIDLNLLVVNNTHIGNHNRRYIFSLMLTNNALLRDIEHIDILVDDSAPEKGTVTEGAKGSPDVDYTEENSTIIHWHGFIDHESGIMKYLVAIGPECLPKNELISKNISDEYHLLQTSSNEARLPLKTIGKNFVSVVAFNNALEPSDVACSDGITFDRSIPKVYNLNISLAKTDANVGCLHEEPWMITANLKRIRLPSNSSGCASICKGKDDTGYIALLPILVKPFQVDKASFLCRYLPMNNDTVIYIPDDTIHVEWSILKSMSQMSEVYIGFGSLRSQHLNPDLLSFQKAVHPGKYTKHHTGLSNGEMIYLYLKTQSKTGFASTSVVGPLLIDETPPICPSSLPVQVANDAVSVNWNSSTFTDKEQMEQIDEILFSVVSERGHKTPIHEWRLRDSRKLCINEHEECINYPIVKLQSMDSQAGLSFFFHFQVFNKAGHSCVFNSESFKLPSIFDPGHAKVIDIIHNESSGAESTDTDVIFDSSKFCIQYSGLREHENVTLSLGLGSDKLLDDVLPFRLLNSSKPARTICIKLNDTTLRRNTKYYATLKAECTGGLTLSSSDGFYVMDDEFLKASISLYNGHSCFDDLRSNHISAHSDAKGVITFADNLSVGHLYTLVSSGDILNITSNDVLIQSTTNNKAEFVPMNENPHIVITKNISLAELYACVQDETIFISSTEVSFSWVVDASVSKFVSHYEVGVQRKKQNETYDDIFEFIIKNTTFFKLRKRLNSGSYRGYIAPCFGPICGPQIFAESFTFTSTKPRAGDMKCNVTFYSLDNIEVSGQFDTFSCSSVDDSILFYRYGLFKDSLGTSLVGEKRIAPSSIGKTLKFNYTFEGDVSPRQTLYFCTEGFCRSTLSTTSCVQTLHDVKFNQFDKTHVFEFDKRGRSEFQKTSSRLTSTKLFEKLTLMENLDVDFVRSDSTVTGLVFPDTVGRRTWFLMTQRRVPAIDCTDDDACIQSKLFPDPVVSFPLNTGYSGILYLCLDESLSIGFDNSTLEPPSTSSCSNGFKIDDEKPVSGTVTISSDDGFLTSSSEMIVGWEGFKDQDPPSTDGPLRKQIAFYEIAIGTQPEKQDVLPYTSVGLGTKINIEDISLRTGLAYYATVKAYDKAGNMAKAFSPGVIVDETPPSTGTINVGSSFWHRKVIGGNTVEVHWEGFEDNESGIGKFEIAVGTKPHIDDVVPYTKITGKLSAVLAMNRSTTGEQNFVTLIATNRAGLFTVAYSEAFVFDHTPPRPGVVRDGSIKDNHDKDFQYQSTSISAHWTLFSDSESGISYYRVGLGFTPEKGDVYSLHYVGNQTSWTWHGSFIHGAKYYALVEACNDALLCTKIASNGILIDDSPPIPGLVRIGNLDHTTRYIPKRTSVSAKWIGFQDPQSGIREFHVCIGSNETTCDIMPLRNALLSDSYIATGLNLPTMTPLFFTVRAINHLEMTTISSSDRFFVDDTSPILIRAPRFTNCVNENEVHYQIDASRLCIKWNITDEESSIISQTLKYRTHDDGHVPVEHLVLGNFQTFQLILNPTDRLFSGDTYTASITACNAAGLCTSAESGRLMIDSSAPHVGGFMRPMSWACSNKTCSINLTWYGFLDVESGIENYIISVGKTYSGVELKNPYLVSSKDDVEFQNASVTLDDTFDLNDKIVLSISAINKAGLRSSIAKVTVEAEGSKDVLGSKGTLVVEKHSCDIHYCNNDCTCAAFGKKCEPEKHLACHNDSISNKSSMKIFVLNTIQVRQKQVFMPGSCIKAVWNGTDDAIRYEWSIGIEGMPEGEGIFDIKIEPVWYDVGLDKNITFCTNQKLPIQHGYSYVVYVRQWVSQTTYTQFASAGILVDYTPPLVRKGKFVKESIDSCLNDIEFSTENTTLTACWKGVFSDQQSGILHYFVSLGTIPEGDDVMKSENIGLLETKRWTGLSLNQGTKYFVTVMAVNNIGLSTSSYSDGVVIDFEKPVNGVVFNTIYHRNTPAQAADKVIGSSWHGFNDRHSFIKEYLVALFECDGQSNLTSLRYVNVGLRTKHQFKGAPLKHNRNYCIAVKAIDAAGFESNVSLSTPLLIDKTPPKGIKCTAYEVTDFAFIDRQIHDQGLEFIGPISFKKDEFLKFKINVLKPVQNAIIQISFLDKIWKLVPHASNENVIFGEFEYLAEDSGSANVSIFVSNIYNASFYQHEISKCKKHSEIQKQTDRSIQAIQLSVNTVGIQLNIVDLESAVQNVSLSIGTIKDGNHVYKMASAGLMRFFTLDTDVPHGSPIHASVMVENTAGIRFYDQSNPITMDHTAPEICCGDIAFTYKETENTTMTSVSMKWAVIDAESGLDFCILTLGSLKGAEDILQRQLIAGSASSFETNDLSLSHGDKVYASIKCTNSIRMWATYHMKPRIVSFEKPNKEESQAVFVTNEGQIKRMPSELDTNLTIVWDGFDDISGLSGYECIIPGDPKRKWRRSGKRTSYTIPLGPDVDGDIISTSIRAKNIGGITSEPFTAYLNVTSQQPKLSGIPCTIEKLLGVEYKIVWDNIFMKEEDLVYTVNIGTAEGNADLIQNRRSTETHVILDIEDTDEIFVAIEAKSETGLTCNYRKMMKIDV